MDSKGLFALAFTDIHTCVYDLIMPLHNNFDQATAVRICGDSENITNNVNRESLSLLNIYGDKFKSAFSLAKSYPDLIKAFRA